MPNDVRRCVFCGRDDIVREREHDRIVTVECQSCGAVFRVEFDPPDEPDLRGRIDVLVDPNDGDPTGIGH
jgi:uncharacterized Zn finger protein